MELRFLFDGVLYNNPITWDEVGSGLEFDSVNQIITVNHDTQHEWKGDVYNLLYDRWKAGTFCSLIELKIEANIRGAYVLLYTGYISISESTFNERRRTVSVKIKDDSFGARIENNKGVEVALDSVESKNLITITPALESFVFAFTSSDGVYLTDSCRGYAVYDAFDYLIKWMTDDQVGFESNFFDPTGTGEGYLDWLVSGIDLRNAGTTVSAPKISFQQLFDQMRKVRNIMMGFERDSLGNPIVRIEDIDYFRSSTNTVSITDIEEIELSFDTNILYTSVEVGTDIIRPANCDDGNTVCNASNNVSYFGFDKEVYSLSGECVSGTELVLTTDDPFVIDTNKIQEVVEFDDDTYDQLTFLIRRDSAAQQNADQSDPLGIGEYWYNEAYTNKEVLSRYQDYLTGTLSLFNLYNGYNLFKATGNISSGLLSPLQTPTYTNYTVPLNVEVYDPQNRFDLTTDRFTPVDEGAYQFKMGIAIDDAITSDSGVIVSVFLNVEHYDSTGTLIQKYSSDIRTHTTRLSSPIFEEWTSEYISMDSGDYTIFTVDYAQNLLPATAQAIITLGGSSPDLQYFQCLNSAASVQDAQVNTGSKRHLAISSFEYDIPFDTAQSMLNDTTQQIRITSKDIDRTGYLKSLRYNYITGNAEIEILSNG